MTSINRRVNKLYIGFKLAEDRDVDVSVDGTGTKMGNGSEHIERKKKNKRKKYIKVTISADPRKRKLLDCDVSIEGEGDSEPESALKHLEKLKKNGKKVRKFWGDPALDERNLINHLSENGADIAIKPRRLDTSDAEESLERKKLVEHYKKKGYKKWAREKEYGLRWVGTEGVFSAVKRKFGECVKSKKLINKLKEVKRKFWAYDLIQEYGIIHRLWIK
ncbi:MAG TPA: hypothetical protein EYP30_01270 [Archaeoglobaceae archaeon]|nr:hypothetical protein [Archaeoglobaceae archaeon]